MNYFLYKLRFSTAAHFGASDSALGLLASEDHFRADTLFSAMCLELARSGRELDSFVEMVQKRGLLLTDSMPYIGERFFLPKPILRVESEQDVPSERRKLLKNIRWIPADDFLLTYDQQIHFGSVFTRTQANIPSNCDTVPYDIGLFGFARDCGLYFVAALSSLEQETMLTTLLKHIGLTGIGGRVSSGFGKFEIDDIIYLNEPFDAQTEALLHGLMDSGAQKQMMLTTALPSDEELETVLENASFQISRRGGFVQSETFHDEPLKKKTQYFLSAGSVVSKMFSGGVYQVGASGAHPVYRYSIPIFWGLPL